MAEFIAKWWDVILFGILALLHIYAWVESQRSGRLNQQGQDDEARRSGAQMITTSSAAGITAVSILVPASMLIVQLWSGGTSFPLDVVTQVYSGALWFLLSLGLGLWVVFLVPLRSHAIDVRKSIEIGIPFGLQLLSLLVGMARLIWGLHNFLLVKGG